VNIVSLLPGATELIWELGLAESLVAISHECDVPVSVQGLPRVTGSSIPSGLNQSEINDFVAQAVAAEHSLYTVDAQRIRALEPDIVLTQGLCDVCGVTSDTIETSLKGVSCTLPASTEIISFDSTTIDGIVDDFMKLALRTGSVDVATRRVTQSRSSVDEFSQAPASTRVLLLEWIDPAYSPGHWVPEQIELAGLVSAIGDPGDHSRALTPDELKASRPDAIGVICCGFKLEQNIEFARTLRSQISDWFSGDIVAFDANRSFSRPTLRVFDGVRQLNQAFVSREESGPGFKRI
jgi:iron complex transport system substrate-binding protein